MFDLTLEHLFVYGGNYEQMFAKQDRQVPEAQILVTQKTCHTRAIRSV